MHLFSYEIYKTCKNILFYRKNLCLTRVFKGVWDKNQCDYLQYIPDLAEKGICCRENPEAATAIFL